jgi:hypothetical protein
MYLTESMWSAKAVVHVKKIKLSVWPQIYKVDIVLSEKISDRDHKARENVFDHPT